MTDVDDEEQPASPFALGRSETTTSATTVGITNNKYTRHNNTNYTSNSRSNHGIVSSTAAAASTLATVAVTKKDDSVSRASSIPSAAATVEKPRVNLLDESLDAVLDDSDDDDDDYDDDEDGIEIPPPPPPPPPPKLSTWKERISAQLQFSQSWRPRSCVTFVAKSSTTDEKDGGGDTNSCYRIVTLTKSGTETTTMNDNNNNCSTNNNHNDKKQKRRVGMGIALLLLLLLLTGMALGLGLGMRGESNNHSEKNSSSSSSSNEASANDVADTAEKGVDQEVDSTTTDTATTTYDVIIIGAGWAGIRALETLLLQNITNVLLLESTSVIGGRCRSYNADGSVNNPDNIINIDDDSTASAATTTYNVGADWLYANTDMSNVLLDSGYLDGISNTYPASDTAIPMGLLTGRYYRQTATTKSSSSIVDDDTTDDDGITTTVTAEVMSQQSSSNLMNDIWGNFHTLRSNELNDMFGMSYDDAINYYIDNNEWLYDYSINTDDDAASKTTTTTTAGMAIDFLNFMKTSSEIENSGDSSSLDITDINFVPPGYTSESIYMGGIGFGNVVAQYAQKYISYIMLNSRVITIDSSEESTPDVTVVSYVTDSDDDEDESGSTTTTTTVQAKTVLVTVSLGVLKSDRIQFIPPLPENKRTIINAMGYGTLNKCILSWKSNDAIVWPVDESWFMLLTESNTNDDDFDDEEESAAAQRRQRWTTFFNPTLLTNQPTLVAYVGGDDAKAIESQTRNEVVEDVMTNLRSMFPDITNPDNVIVTRWGSEEDFYGAYAYPIAGRVMAEDAAILAEPIGRIYFAGEATSATRWGTTMGAWNTGEEQAYAITTRLLGW